MSRKIYVEVKVKLLLRTDADDAGVNDALEDMDYAFHSNDDLTNIEDTEIIGFEIKDSK